MIEIVGGWYMGKSSKGIPPLSRSKLIKKHNISRMKLKKLYDANKWCNDWRFQLHWHKI